MSAWHADWAWSLLLIIITVVIHVLGLGVINERIVGILGGAVNRRRYTVFFTVVMGAAALVVTVLHAFEASVWAAAYWLLGALPDTRRRCFTPSARSLPTAMRRYFLIRTGR